MPPSCMAHGGSGFRGPPVPLILVPVVIHLVRSSCDAKMAAYLREISKGGPVAIAENAHKVAQYALSKLPSNVLWWFTSKVLNLSPELALQTTEFLKSRTELDASLPALGEAQPQRGSSRLQIEGKTAPAPSTALLMPSDIERRLEMLEQHYRALQEKHEVSLKLLEDKPEAQGLLLREPPPPEQETPQQQQQQQQQQQIEPASNQSSMQVMKLESQPEASSPAPSPPAEGQALLQDVGLRLGKIILEWAGDTMKQRLVSAAAARSSSSSSSPGNQAFLGAGVDLAERLVDAIAT